MSKLKFIPFYSLIIFVITIQIVSACSIRYPEFVRISTIQPTNDPNRLFVAINNQEGNKIGDLVYDVEKQQIETVKERDKTLIEPYATTSIDYDFSTIIDGRLLNLYVTDNFNRELLNVTISIDNTTVIDPLLTPIFFISDTLDLGYLIYQLDLIEDNVTRIGSLFIINMTDPTQITKTYLPDNIFDWWGLKLYDDFNILFLGAGGADCRNGYYLKYNSDGLQLMYTVWAWVNHNFDPINSRFLSISYDYNTNNSQITIQSFDGNITEYTVTGGDLLDMIKINSMTSTDLVSTETNSETLRLNSISWGITILSLFTLGLYQINRKKRFIFN